ncbi:NUDIX hydrolase [Streptomyces apocyni]|uniref:NUDIX hydrolase n=1 Tax=Streptomyces apocyni TaxID=2654677 RepID=UPI0012EAFCEE|nr:NUDIX domain-containing protein [Streptomyces apocyni]
MSEHGELVERVDERDRVIGIVDRGEAIRRGWLHRVATAVCRDAGGRDDAGGRILVHRRPDGVSRFPGQYNFMVGGAVDVGESYAQGAVREIEEELGVRVPVRHGVTFLCRGAISPYWLGVHEAVVRPSEIRPDPAEFAWHGWWSEDELRGAMTRLPFVPDAVEAYARLRASRCSTGR